MTAAVCLAPPGGDCLDSEAVMPSPSDQDIVMTPEAAKMLGMVGLLIGASLAGRCDCGECSLCPVSTDH